MKQYLNFQPVTVKDMNFSMIHMLPLIYFIEFYKVAEVQLPGFHGLDV